MSFNKTRFTTLQLSSQIKNDLFSKEVVTGYSATYSWIAAQLGHIAIGFIPSVILISLFTYFFTHSNYFSLLAIIPIVYIIYKEQHDLTKEIKIYNDIQSIYPLNVKEIKQNIYTSDWFVIFGSLLAAASNIMIPIFPVIMFILCSIPSFYVIKYWLTKKLCFQKATLPYQFRLFNYSIKKIIDPIGTLNILDDFQNKKLNHLIITGPLNSGKTTLGTAIGTEMSFNQVKLRYFTLINFLEICNSNEDFIHIEYPFWDWKECDVLIIDNVDICSFIKLKETNSVIHLLNLKNIVWILNDNEKIKTFEDELNSMFFNWNVSKILLKNHE